MAAAGADAATASDGSKGNEEQETETMQAAAADGPVGSRKRKPEGEPGLASEVPSLTGFATAAGAPKPAAVGSVLTGTVTAAFDLGYLVDVQLPAAEQEFKGEWCWWAANPAAS